MMLCSDLEPFPPVVDHVTAKRGGFMRGNSPLVAGCGIIEPFTRPRTADEKRAFHKRVAKRRAKKGYR